MKRKSALVIAAALFLSTSSLAYAENSSHEDAMKPQHPEIRGIMQKDHMQMKDTMKQNRDDFKASMSAARQEMKAKFQAQHDAFKAKVAELKDQKKQTTVTNVTDRFATINTKQTDRMSQSLIKLSTILDKLSSRAATLKTSGKDTSAVDADIATAKKAITTAQTAVSAQAAKQYVPTVTDDTTLRENVKATFTQMKNDLETTHKTVKAAKEAVLTVAKDIAKLSETTE